MRVGAALVWPSESSWRDCVSASACDRHLGDSCTAMELLEAETKKTPQELKHNSFSCGKVPQSVFPIKGFQFGHSGSIMRLSA